MKRMISLLTVLVFLFQAQAQLLWKVSGNGTGKVSYVFGTHHVAPLHICDSIAGFREAFDSCEQLYGEVVMDDLEKIGQQMLPYMMLPQDTLLDRLLTPDEYGKLDAVLKKETGMSAENFKSLTPAAIAMQLAVISSIKTFPGYDPRNQLDATMQKQAREKGWPVKGLETIQFQTEMIFCVPRKEQVTSLMKMVNRYDRMAEYSSELNLCYMRQDLDDLLSMTDDPDLGSTPEEMEKMLYGRNRNWVAQFTRIFPETPTFIVVGAGHLPGEQGVLELLRQEGYTVEAVM